MAAKKVSNKAKAATTNSALATAASVSSVILGGKLVKYGLTLEQGALLVGGFTAPLFALLGNWMAKLNPHD